MTDKRITTLEEYYNKFPYPTDIITKQQQQRLFNESYVERLSGSNMWLAQNLYPNTYTTIEAKRAREETARKGAEKAKAEEQARIAREAEERARATREAEEQARIAREAEERARLAYEAEILEQATQLRKAQEKAESERKLAEGKALKEKRESEEAKKKLISAKRALEKATTAEAEDKITDEIIRLERIVTKEDQEAVEAELALQRAKEQEGYATKALNAVSSGLGAFASAIGFNKETGDTMYPSRY